LCEILQLFKRIVRQQERKIECAEFRDGICGRITVEDLVVLVDFGFERWVDGD